MIESYYGLHLCISDTVVEQFRFPRTKKRRIRNKWSKRPINFRPSRKALQMGNSLYMHPFFAAQLKASLSQ